MNQYTVIFKQGDFEMKMYSIISGKVAIYTNYGKVEIIDETEFMQYLDDNHDKAIAIIKTLSSRLRGLTLDYMEACGTIAEICNEKTEEKKGGLWDRVKKFAELGQQYANAYNELQSAQPSAYEYIEKTYAEYGKNPASVIMNRRK